MKKTLALILAVVLCLGLFAGCAKPAEPDTTTGAGDTTAAPAETTETPKDDKELTTVTVLCQSWNSHGNEFFRYKDNPRWEKIPMIKEFYDQLAENGIRLEYEVIDNEQYNESVKTRLMTGVDLPDVIANPGMSNVESVQVGEAGIVADINQVLDEYDEDGSVKAYWEKTVGPWMSTITTDDGKLFWLPYIFQSRFCDEQGNPVDIPFDTTHHVLVREDWIKAIGQEWKQFYTPDEFADLLIALNENDANGNGVKDEVLGNLDTRFYTGFEAGFGMTQGLVNVLNDGKGVQCNFYNENFPAYIQFLQKLYNAGVVDTTVLSGTNVKAANRASTVLSYTTEGWEEAAIVGYQDTAVYSPVILDDDEGANGFMIPNVDNSQMVLDRWFINANSEHMDAVVKLFDLMYTDEFAESCYWGKEGVHYTVNENGIRTAIPGAGSPDPNTPAEMLTTRVLTSSQLPNVRDAVVLAKRNDPPAGREDLYAHKYDVEWWCKQNCDKMTYSEAIAPFAMANQEELDTLARVETTLMTYIDEMMLGLITGEKSLDDFPTYLTEMEELGLKDYIEVFKAQHQRFLDTANAAGIKTLYN